MSRRRTLKLSRNLILGTTPIEALGPNPRRKAFLLSPVASGLPGQAVLTAQAFVAGAGQLWVVPAGVTAIVGMFVWGAGGNGGAGGAADGGGGGGGGGFDSAGPFAVTPGDAYHIDVRAGGTASTTTIKNAGLVTICGANSGGNAALDVAGVGDVGTVGITPKTGGNGFAGTAAGGSGQGGGGAAGAYANGSNAAGVPGGAGGGGATILTYGAGGVGGAGSGAGNGSPGVAPGGGGGGGFADAVTPGDGGTGGDGLAVIFYVAAPVDGYVSLSDRPDVTPGKGTLNYVSGQTFPTLITDEDVGDVIGEPWYAVSSDANVVIQIMEFTDVDAEPIF